MASEKVQKVDVAIIGAGWFGLAAAKLYLRLRPDVKILIIDNDSTVGGVWSEERLYPNLVAQVRLGLFNYSDTPMPPNNGDPNDIRVTGEMIYEYLQKYAEDHDLIRRCRFNTFVENAEQTPKGWRLTLKDSDNVIEAGKLLIATGVASNPRMPTFEGEPSIPIIHSRDLGTSYKDIKSESVETVVVAGAAKSAYDAVYLLLSMGKKVTWVIRPGGAGPLAILPFNILNLLNPIAVASTRLMTHLSPSILATEGPLYWLFQRTTVGRWCVGRFWDFMHYVSGHHAGYKDGDHIGMLKPDIDRQSVFWAHSGLGVVTMPDFWKTMHGGSLNIVRDEISTIENKTVSLKSGHTLTTDYAVMCTGWGDHFSMFSDSDRAKAGVPSYSNHGDFFYDITSQPTADLDIDWASAEASADAEVVRKLPFLSKLPNLKHPELLDPRRQKKWRLYKRAIPLNFAARNDRSLAILGQIHTVQTPILAEVQSFYVILWMEGLLDMPGVEEMAREVCEWNAWTRRRYLNQGQKYPYALYDFLPYVDSMFKDLGLSSRRKGNFITETLSPYHPHDFEGFVEEWLAKRGEEEKVGEATPLLSRED